MSTIDSQAMIVVDSAEMTDHIWAFGPLVLLIVVYFISRVLSKRTCYGCHQRVPFQMQPEGVWICPSCATVNGKGDTFIPKMERMELNRFRFCDQVISQQNLGLLSTFESQSQSMCDKCCRNQKKIVNKLAQLNDDNDKVISDYRTHLEAKYPLCFPCQRMVKEKLKEFKINYKKSILVHTPCNWSGLMVHFSSALIHLLVLLTSHLPRLDMSTATGFDLKAGCLVIPLNLQEMCMSVTIVGYSIGMCVLLKVIAIVRFNRSIVYMAQVVVFVAYLLEQHYLNKSWDWVTILFISFELYQGLTHLPKTRKEIPSPGSPMIDPDELDRRRRKYFGSPHSMSSFSSSPGSSIRSSSPLTNHLGHFSHDDSTVYSCLSSVPRASVAPILRPSPPSPPYLLSRMNRPVSNSTNHAPSISSLDSSLHHCHSLQSRSGLRSSIMGQPPFMHSNESTGLETSLSSMSLGMIGQHRNNYCPIDHGRYDDSMN